MNSTSGTMARLSPAVLRAAMDYLAADVDSPHPDAPATLAQVSQTIYANHHKRRTLRSAVEPASDGLVDNLVHDLPTEVPRFDTEPVTRPRDDTEGTSSVVLVRGVRVHVPDSQLVRLTDGELTARLPALRINLSPGHVSYVHRSPRAAERPDSLLRFYVGIGDATAAPTIWREVLRHLCTQGLRFTAKCLHMRDRYPASDALVVYTSEASFGPLEELAEALARMPGISTDSSVFTRQMAPGSSVAVEVRGAHPRPISFGEHRASALARGLFEARRSGRTDRENIARAVVEAFEEDGIDPAHPYLPLRHTEYSGQVKAWLEGAP